MAEEEETKLDLDGLRAQVTRQGGLVRTLKKEGAAQEEVTAAVNLLKQFKVQLEAAVSASEASSPKIDRAGLEDLLRRRMFVIPSFEIYGGCGGFFDFGPPGCALKSNFLDLWRRHFVAHEDMLEIECTTMTPDIVLRTSGHVDKFTDLMVKDPSTGECFRADKLLEDHIENLVAGDAAMPTERREELERIARQADSYAPEELGAILTELGVKSPSTGADLTAPFPFNLMFASNIGPEGNNASYLRPETAQGIFINFRRLLDFNGSRMPFAAAQIGLAFRNEISPRAGLLRVREFTMAEIEHFVDPDEKDHPKFASVADLKLCLFPRDRQVGDGKTVSDVTLGEAVSSGVIDNETLAYFMARTALFLSSIGINPQWLRFRQHLQTEMAHYASDCWDAELYTSYGWVECVGIADRSCYDLGVHAAKSKVDLTASKRLDEPLMVDAVRLKANKGLMGRSLKKNMQGVMAALEALPVADAMALESSLEESGEAEFNGFTLTRQMLSVERTTKKLSEVRYAPSVIEPSFGVGRILYSLMEHSFWVRQGDDKRSVLSFPAAIAPFKVAVLPLSANAEFRPAVERISQAVQDGGLSCKVDASSTTIGRRYSRMDEVGVPYGVTVDFETAITSSVTLRERDSTAQVRVPECNLVTILNALVVGRVTFDEIRQQYPVVAEGVARDGTPLSCSEAAQQCSASGATAAPATVALDSTLHGKRRLRFTRPAPQ
jgi:glycyl-tRNA synthetase